MKQVYKIFAISLIGLSALSSCKKCSVNPKSCYTCDMQYTAFGRGLAWTDTVCDQDDESIKQFVLENTIVSDTVSKSCDCSKN